MPELSQQFGTQTYEQQVVELSKAGEEQFGRYCQGGAIEGGASTLVV